MHIIRRLRLTSGTRWSKWVPSSCLRRVAATGRRYGSDVGGVQGGYGWSATPDGASYANCLYFGSGGAGTDSYGNRIYGLAVRLVQSL